MKNSKKLLAMGLGLALLFSQGWTTAEAKSNHQKPKSADKNKNGIDDKWEKKYKLSGKNVAGQDNDKDGLTNVYEYKLNLNPKLADTNKNKMLDGQEDNDKDGVSNLAEIDLGLNPVNPDTDKDNIKDGDEKNKDGVKLTDKVLEFEIKIQTADKKNIEVEYKTKKGKTEIKVKDKTGTVTKEMITALVTELQNPTSLSGEQIVAKIQEILKIENPLSIKMELEYADGEDQQIDHKKDNDEDHQDNDHHDDDDEDQHHGEHQEHHGDHE
jgi:hypothetical protein